MTDYRDYELSSRIRAQDEGAGGSTNLVLNVGDISKSQKLVRYMSAKPSMVVVQISADLQTMASTQGFSVTATVNWQLAGAGHQAVVEVNRGTVFVVGAAEVVDVLVTLSTGDGTAAFAATTVHVEGTACAAKAPNPTPAYVTTTIRMVAGVPATSPIIPAMARRLAKVLSNLPAALTNTIILFSDAGGTGIYSTGADNENVPVVRQAYKNSASDVSLSTQTLTLVWEVAI